MENLPAVAAPEVSTAVEGKPSVVSDQELRDLFSDLGRMRRRVLLFIRQSTPVGQRTMHTDDAEFRFMALAQLLKNLVGAPAEPKAREDWKLCKHDMLNRDCAICDGRKF